jgi:hypothetical protein
VISSRSKTHQQRDMLYVLGLLRPRGEREHSQRTTETSNEFPSSDVDRH